MDKVLIIDDDQVIRERLKKLIELSDYDVYSAEDGKSGLEVFQKESPQVVVLDIKMPGMDGIEVLTNIKEELGDQYSAEVIMVTGHAGVETAIEALKIGAYSYIQKPIEFDELEITIKQALAKQKTEKKLKQHVEELKVAKQKAEVANKAKSIFLANMSHEVRTPLNTILGFSKILKKSKLDDQQQEHLDAIIASGDLLISILNDIINISKIEAGEINIEHKNFNLPYLIETAITTKKQKINKKKVELFFDYDENLIKDFIGDPTGIRQILLNILDNAIKFTEEGSIRISVKENKLKSSDGENRHMVDISLKDTGVGIPKNMQDIIFSAFTQVDPTMTRKFGGTGLGLHLAKRLVTMLGGQILVNSEGEKKGSEFIMTLPLEKGHSIIEQKVTPVSRKSLEGIAVMIVDENQEARTILERFCIDAGMKVCGLASSAEEAIEYLVEESILPQIILCDIRLPGKSGYELAEEIKSMDAAKGIPIIAVTILADPGVAQQAKKGLFDAYIAKPIKEEELLRVIQLLIGRGDTPSEIITKHLSNEIILKGLKVLVAEDVQTDQDSLVALLKQYGCEFEVARTGQEALEKLKVNRHDAILLDMMMSDMDGFQLSEKIRKDINNAIPIIALSKAVASEDHNRATASGINDFIEKPILVNELRNKLGKLTGRMGG